MNGLKFIRTRCNISLSELADILGVSRQQVSAWENATKPISKKRLNQLSEYFGVDEKYFSEISAEDRETIISKELYLRQDSEKECYSFIKPGEIAENLNFRPYSYPDFGTSLDEQLIQAKKRKQETFEQIEMVMGYFGKPNKIIDEAISINRGCKIYDALTACLNQMPKEAIEMRMIYYNMILSSLFALLLSQGLMTHEEIEKEFEYLKGNSLYDDTEWIYEQANIFKNHYADKKMILEKLKLGTCNGYKK